MDNYKNMWQNRMTLRIAASNYMIHSLITNSIIVIFILFLIGCNTANNCGGLEDGIYFANYVTIAQDGEPLPPEKRHFVIEEKFDLPLQLAKNIIVMPAKKMVNAKYSEYVTFLIYKSEKDFFSIIICTNNYEIVIFKVVPDSNKNLFWCCGEKRDVVKITFDKNFTEEVYKSLKRLKASKRRNWDIEVLEAAYPEFKTSFPY